MNTIQVIKRSNSVASKKSTYAGEKVQISYNSDERICIRLHGVQVDDLFVLDNEVTSLLISFIKKLK